MSKKNTDRVLTAFGKRVKELREEQGLTQLDLSAKSGVEVRQIGRIENGAVNTSLAVLSKLATGFGITLSELMEGV